MKKLLLAAALCLSTSAMAENWVALGLLTTQVKGHLQRLNSSKSVILNLLNHAWLWLKANQCQVITLGLAGLADGYRKYSGISMQIAG